MGNKQLLKRIKEIMEDNKTTLYVKKKLSLMISNICKEQETRKQMVESGFIQVLHTQIQNDNRLKSQNVKNCLSLLSFSYNESVGVGDHSWSVSPSDLEIMKSYFDPRNVQHKILKNFDPIFDSGLILYLHTTLGGALWGAYESIRGKMPPKSVKHKFFFYFYLLFIIYYFYFILFYFYFLI